LIIVNVETYLKEAEEILARVLQVDELIQSTEDIINISLDSQRNSLLLLELRLAMGTFAVANGALVSSFFGMNLLTGMENHPAAFWGVSATSFGLVAAVFVWCSRRLRQNQ
jgi:magnesium transporter